MAVKQQTSTKLPSPDERGYRPSVGTKTDMSGKPTNQELANPLPTNKQKWKAKQAACEYWWMRVLYKVLLALAALVLLTAPGVCGWLFTSPVVTQTGDNTESNKISFSEDEPLQQPVTLSPDVLKVLLETKEAKLGLELANDSARDNPTRLFRATEVHLSRSDGVDLVVIGIPPMRGADNCWFWVVRSVRNHPKVVLFAGGYSLEILYSRTNGLKDIGSVWSSPNETRNIIYHFDGKKYKPWKEKWTQNRN